MSSITINKQVFLLLVLFVGVVGQTFFYDNLGIGFFRLTDELLIVLFILFLFVRVIYRQKSDISLISFVILFLVLLLVSMVQGNMNPSQNIIGFFEIYKNAIFFLVLPYVLRILRIEPHHISLVVKIGLTIMLVYTVLFYIFPTSILNHHQNHVRMGIYRLSSIVSDINTFSAVLYLTFFAIHFKLVDVGYNKFWKILIVIMLFLTFSRSTIFLFMLSYFLVHLKNNKYILSSIPFLLIIISMFYLYDKYQKETAENVKQVFTWVPTGYNFENPEFGKDQYRSVVYYKSINMFLESPLFGHGLGTFGTPISLKLKNDLYVRYSFPQTEFIPGGFNVQDVYYPIIYVQTGLFGLILFFLFWYRLLVSRNIFDSQLHKFSKLMFFSMLVLSLNSMTFMIGSLMFYYALLLNTRSMAKRQDHRLKHQNNEAEESK